MTKKPDIGFGPFEILLVLACLIGLAGIGLAL